jgi:hypothetical protein
VRCSILLTSSNSAIISGGIDIVNVAVFRILTIVILVPHFQRMVTFQYRNITNYHNLTNTILNVIILLSFFGGKMATKKRPTLSYGTLVRTTQEDPDTADSWTEEGKQARKWGVEGMVMSYRDSHGLCYRVRHRDGTTACYDPTELQVL